MNKSLTRKLNRNKGWRWSGERQKQARKDMGWSLATMAHVLGITKQSLSDHELGKSIPTASIQEKIFFWTSKPPRYFFVEQK